METHSEQVDQLADALVRAQKEFKNPAKNLTGRDGNREYKYADLADTLEAVKGALNSNGIAVLSSTEYTGEWWVVSTKLLHISGQWIASSLPIPTDSRPKEMGSIITYWRRYQLSAMTGIAAEDDDDADAAEKVKPATKPQTQEESSEEPEQTWSFDAAMALAVDKLHQYARPLVEEFGQDRKTLVGFVGEIASRPPFEFIDELNLDDIRAVYKAAKDAMSQEIDRRVAEANGA